MIIEYVRYRVTGSTDAFEAAYASAQASLAESPNCQHWELAQCHEEPTCYILRLHWDTLDGHMVGFRKGRQFRAFFAAIKPYIDQIEEMRHYVPTKVRRRSLCEALGGPAVIFNIAHSMHMKMCADELLGPKFSHAADTHVPHLGMWLTEVFGGPALYSAVFSDISPMLRRHANQSIVDKESARFVELAMSAVSESAPQADQETTAAVQRYFQWGAGVAQENSRPDHEADPKAGVPEWDFET